MSSREIEHYYRLLDLTPDASEAEVKKARRELTMVWHPDRFHHDGDLRRKAENNQQDINETYDEIINHANLHKDSSGAYRQTQKHDITPEDISSEHTHQRGR